MKKTTGTKKTQRIWMIALIVLLVLLPFLVPSSIIESGAEAAQSETEGVPVYEPVTLANPSPDPVVTVQDKRKNEVPVYGANPEGIQTDPAGYLDSTLSVRMIWRTITNSKGVPTPVLFTYIQIADPSQFRAAFSDSYAREAHKLVHIPAKYYNAVLAFDGDWCQGRPDGLVVRNGVEYRRNRYTRSWMLDALIVDTNGDFHILQHPELSDLEQFDGRILHSFVFGPAMVIDGELIEQEKNNYGTDGGMWLEMQTQRQVFCQMGPLSYLLITTEGQDSKSKGGFTGNEVARIALESGALQAYNMDGGASAQTVLVQGLETMWDGAKEYVYKRINDPYIPDRRTVCDIVYFCTAEQTDLSGQ